MGCNPSKAAGPSTTTAKAVDTTTTTTTATPAAAATSSTTPSPAAAPAIDLPELKVLVHNKELEKYIKDEYTEADVRAIWDLLKSKNSLNFPTVEGRALFKAALEADESSQDYTGYDNVWVRDNIHVAHAHYAIGQHQVATANINDLISFWLNNRERWTNCITRSCDFRDDVMTRPHIRFNGSLLQENDQKWAHAQNDALGYFTWLAAKLAREGHLFENNGDPSDAQAEILVFIVLFFNSTEFWQDEDSGHWEEARKVEASSIGAVTAGLKELLALLNASDAAKTKLQAFYTQIITNLSLTVNTDLLDLTTFLLQKGETALQEILPFESRVPFERKSDAALLFLIYPLGIVQGDMARQVVKNVVSDLAGAYGIRRYLGDSYWMADYKVVMSQENRTADFSDNMDARDQFLKTGQEAQWCIFDSIVSCIFGEWYLQAKKEGRPQSELDALRKQQVLFFNRAVGQITGEDCHFGAFWCPESYYIEQGKYVSNDVCPLLWTQANLINAMHVMIKTL
ncbi:hypothetical protein HDU85_000717 [Gaertneriomyces sp. JEL0708]|nr:hypothetical protein HDU85_000717 [Gaertneriomyces sp. JEL0708]